MSANALRLDVSLEPVANIPKFNAFISEIKSSLGVFGAGIKLIDETKFNATIKGIEDEAKKAAGGIDKISDATDRANKNASLFGKAFKFNETTQAFTTLTSSVASLSQPFVALDTATANLRTLGAEAAAMAPNLREAAISMSKDLPFAAAELQTTMFDALASGVKGGEAGLKSFADTAAKLATGGGSAIGDSTKLLAGQLNAYGKSAEDAAKFSDIFFNTVNFGVTSIPELSATLSNVIPTAASLGIEIENVGASLAVMTSKGVPTAQSTTKLNQLLLELAKPGAALAPILQKAGVSLASLKQDDLPVTLKKVSDALASTGKSALQVFSSSDAGAAFNVLAGDLEGFSQTFEDVRDTTGSAQFAYEQMADSIGVRTQQMKAAAEAFLIQGMDKIGSGFVFVANASQQLAPVVGTLAGLKAVVPDGLVKNTIEFGKGILARVVPSLFAQTAATGAATGAQVGLNAAMLANPVGAIIAGVVALGAATKLLSDALHETAAEKLEDAKASSEVLQAQRDATAARLDGAIAAQNSASSYIKLATEQQNLAKEQAAGNLVATQSEAAQTKLTNSLVGLAGKFPGAVSGSNSLQQNLDGLQKASEQNADKIIGLGAELFKLDAQLNTARNFEISLGVDVAKEDLENQLTDALDGGWVDSLKSVFVSGDWIKKIAGGDLGGAARDFADTFTFGFSDEISEFFTGTSVARKAGEDLTKKFSDEVYGATNAADITKAQADFVAKVSLDGDKMGMSKAEQQKAIKGFNDFAEKRKAALKQIAENDKNLTAAQSGAIVKVFDGSLASGKSLADTLKKISEEFGISKERAEKVAIADQFKKATAEGKSTEQAAEDVAKMFGKGADEVKKITAEQEKNTAEAKKTEEAVKTLADTFNEVKKAADGAVSAAVGDVSELNRQISDAKKRGDDAEVERLKKQKAEKVATGRQDVANQKALAKDAEDAQIALGLKENKKLDSLADAIKKQQTELANRRRDLSITALGSEYEREVASAEKAKAARLSVVADEIAKTEKLKNVSSKEKEQLLAALNERKAFEEQSNEEMDAVRAKHAAKRAQDELKRYQDEAKSFTEFQTAQISSQQALITELESLDVASSDDALSRLAEIGSQKQALAALQAQKDIDDALAKNRALIKADEVLQAAIQSGNADAVTAARERYADARAEALVSDELVLAATKKAVQDRERLERDSFASISRLRLESNSNLALRERDLVADDAEKVFAERVKAAKGNYALELKAFQDLQQAKRDAETKYVQESNALIAASLSFQKAFTDSFQSATNKVNKEETQKKREELEKQSKDLSDSLKRREITISAFYEKYADISKQQKELDDNAGETMRRFWEAVEKGFGAAAEKMRTLASSTASEYQNTIAANQELKRDIADLAASSESDTEKLLAVNKKYGTSFKSLSDASKNLEKREEKTNESIRDSRSKLIEQTTTATILSIGELAAAGELTLASFTGVVLDSAASLLQAQIPVWVASIFGTEVSKLGIGGIVTAAALTATLYGLVGAAKAALGRKTGEALIGASDSTIDGQIATSTSDNIPRLLSRYEGIVSAPANLARNESGVPNWRAVEFANKHHKSFAEYPAYKATQARLVRDALERAGLDKQIRFESASFKSLGVAAQSLLLAQSAPLHTYDHHVHSLYVQHIVGEDSRTESVRYMKEQVEAFAQANEALALQVELLQSMSSNVKKIEAGQRKKSKARQERTLTSKAEVMR